MAVSKYTPNHSAVYMGLAADAKPPKAATGDKFFVTDNLGVWIFTNAGTWVQIGVYSAATAPPVVL